MRTNLQSRDTSVAVPSTESNTETRPIALAMCVALALNGKAVPMSCPASLLILRVLLFCIVLTLLIYIVSMNSL